MKKIIFVLIISFISFQGKSQKFEFDFMSSSLDETILKDHQYIKAHFLGNDVAKKVKLIDTSKHKIFECGHPSPLSANRGYWFGNQHFSKVNSYLKSIGKLPINWHIN